MRLGCRFLDFSIRLLGCSALSAVLTASSVAYAIPIAVLPADTFIARMLQSQRRYTATDISIVAAIFTVSFIWDVQDD